MVLVAAVLAETACRIMLKALTPAEPELLAETVHCRHDPLLGWSHIPGVHIPNMYGPGKDLTINKEGFRASHPFTPDSKGNKTRIICLGDSFTLGYGVGDQETFCYGLEALAPDLEILNMGQGGYGLGQMYLWYNQERKRIAHKVLLVCYIDLDINRMNTDQFGLYAKPWLKPVDGSLQVMNTPVPDLTKGFWGRRDAWWSGLGCIRLAKAARGSLIRRKQFQGVYQTREELRQTVLILFQELNQMAEDQGADMAVVRLPTVANLNQEDPFYAIIAQDLEQAGFPFIDLAKDFRKLDRQAISKMFIDESTAPKELLRFKGMSAHYSPFGHALVAKWVLSHL